MFKKIMQINKISNYQYQSITQEAHVLKKRRGQPAVLLNKNNLIIKYIYKRSLFSSSTLWPYAIRFRNNSQQLKLLGIQAPTVKEIFYYPTLKCYLVTYPFIPGKILLDFINSDDPHNLQSFAHYIAKLHDKGIYFRDVHLNNLIRFDEDFALIDIHSLKFYKKGITISSRAKNISRMFKKEDHKHFWNNENKKEFLKAYLEVAEFSLKSTKKFLAKLKEHMESSYSPVTHQMLFSHELPA